MFDATPAPDHALLQDPAFAAALRACGQGPIQLPGGQYLLYRRVMGLPVAMLPRATPPPDLSDQLCAAGMGRVPLILSPERPHPVAGLRLRKPVTMARLDLTLGDGPRRAGLHGKWRNALRRAEKSPLRVRMGPLGPGDDLPRLDAQQARARGYRNWPTDLTHTFAGAAPDQTLLCTATLRGHPVARMLFLIHGTRATYHMGLTSAEGRTTNAHHLILWQAQAQLIRKGVITLDLGQLHDQTPGLNQFKRRAGAALYETGGTYLCWTPWRARD